MTVKELKEHLDQFPDHVQVVFDIPNGYEVVRNAHWELVKIDDMREGQFRQYHEGLNEDEYDAMVRITTEPWQPWDEPPDQEYDHAVEGVGSPLYDDEHVIVEDPE